MKRLIAVFMCAAPLLASAKMATLHCEHWPMTMALMSLKNSGMIGGDDIQEKRTKIELLASEKIGRNLYQQVYHMTFYGATGRTIEDITNNQASSVECSISAVDVYVTGKNIGRRQ
ncbi:hypothetical protein [Paraburkholderia dilworthii]|uniref:Uncharacterized protein n=1 Tax=Paraburkholderia dilworthii TaxID=948106 RepID=A0ABW9DD88_9BURK